MSDTLDARRIAAALTTERYGRSLSVVAETGSTNDDARRAADDGAATGHAVVADAQSAGRGSHGRTWSSPPGTDLYLSIVERVSLPPTSIPVLTLAVGLGVARTVEALAPGHRVEVKWPNDVWLDGRKCAGILVESSSTGSKIDAFVIGIGLGVNRREWPIELGGRATSLSAATERAFDREAVLARLLSEVETAVSLLANAGPRVIVAAIDARLALRRAAVRVGGVTGTLDGLADTGALRVRREAGLIELTSGTLRARPAVHLRPWRRSELDAYAAIVCDEATMRPVGGPIRKDEVAGLFERHFDASPDPKWLVVRAGEVDGVPVGSVRLSQVARPDGTTRLEIGYLVRQDHAGRGIGTELAIGMIPEARARGADRLYAKVASSNVASQRVLEHAGFSRDGEPDPGGTLHYVVAV